ncbi:hypothetical protein X896_6277 [Burkholderia pseudomallei ABCPW 1]|nr:hypothetical protein X896_6277 [Burkholderia pseudomallei ABCPW 1]
MSRCFSCCFVRRLSGHWCAAIISAAAGGQSKSASDGEDGECTHNDILKKLLRKQWEAVLSWFQQIKPHASDRKASCTCAYRS